MNELIQIGPISPLRQRLVDDMTMRRCSKETQRNYLRDVGMFSTWLACSPLTASAEDIRRFQIEQQQAGVPAPTMNSIVGALRFALASPSEEAPDGCSPAHTARIISNAPAAYSTSHLRRSKNRPTMQSPDRPARAAAVP